MNPQPFAQPPQISTRSCLKYRGRLTIGIAVAFETIAFDKSLRQSSLSVLSKDYVTQPASGLLEYSRLQRVLGVNARRLKSLADDAPEKQIYTKSWRAALAHLLITLNLQNFIFLKATERVNDDHSI